mmetsp:Transcript_4063/g.12863  ORF Transcript_4063/g.12863 Transcript_4063/m.12863 type:complete len:547 (+) Transcript_4063:623-2263(+)
MLPGQGRGGQAHREELVGTDLADGRPTAVVTWPKAVVQALPVGPQEGLAEGSGDPLRLCSQLAGGLGLLALKEGRSCHEPVVPERVDLDALSEAGREGDAVPQRVHPRELGRGAAAADEPVLGVHPDVVTRAPLVPCDDLPRGLQQPATGLQGLPRCLRIGAHRVEEPEGGVDGVVVGQRLVVVVEAVGDHALAHKAREDLQAGPRVGEAAGRQHEAGQGDHGVATPVGEPGVAREHSHQAAARDPARDQEVVRCLDQGGEALCDEVAAHGLGRSSVHCPHVLLPGARAWQPEVRLLWREREGHRDHRLPRAAGASEEAWRPERLAKLFDVLACPADGVVHRGRHVRARVVAAPIAGNLHRISVSLNADAAPVLFHREPRCVVISQREVKVAEREARTELQCHGVFRLDAVLQRSGVGVPTHMQRLCQPHALALVLPHYAVLAAAETHERQGHALPPRAGDRVLHTAHRGHAAHRRGACGIEQRVVLPAEDARGAAHGEAPMSRGEDPLGLRELLRGDLLGLDDVGAGGRRWTVRGRARSIHPWAD